MAVTRSKSGALPTPAPATNTTAQKPTKRKSASTSKAANKVAKTEDKPELSEAKAATEAAAEKKENDQEDVENIDNTNNGAETTSVPNVTPLVETSTAPATVLEEVKEPTPKTKPLSDMTTVLENPVAAQAAVPAPSTVIQASEPATAAADTAVPPAPTAPSSATIPAPVTQESSAPAKEELVVASTEEPSVHTSSITAIKPFDVVVSDIEGTTTPISFVKDNLVSGTTTILPGISNNDINMGLDNTFPSALDAPAQAPNSTHNTSTFSNLSFTTSQPIVGIAVAGGQPPKDDKTEALGTVKDHTLASSHHHTQQQQQQHQPSTTVSTAL